MKRGRSTTSVLVAITAVAAIVLVCAACGSGGGKPRLATLKCDVQGMTCTGCEQSIVGSVHKIEGVAEVHADFKQGKAVVRFDPRRVKPETIRRAIEKTGYTVSRAKLDG